MTRGGRQPRLRTVLAVLAVVILLLPVMVIYRVFETELARQTEAELYAQAAFIEAAVVMALADERVRQAELGKQIRWRRWAASQGYRKAPAEFSTGGGEFNPVPLTIDPTRQPLLGVPRYPEPVGEQPVDLLIEAAGLRVEPLLRRAQLRTLASARVLDQWGRVVAATNERRGVFAHGMPEVESALSGRPASVLRARTEQPLPGGLWRKSLTTVARAGERTVYVGYPLIIRDRVVGAVVLGRTPRNVMKALYDRRGRVLASAALALLAAVFLAWLVSVAVTGPVSALVRQSRLVERGDARGTRPVSSPVTAEIRQLSDALARTAETLGRRDGYIREFARNVSHEFKTPLTGIRGAVELLGDYGATMSAEEHSNFLANIAGATDRLERLTADMLELARADIVVPEQQRFVLGELLDEIRERYAGRGLRVDVEGDALDAGISMKSAIADTIVANLLDNSLRHRASRVVVRALALSGERIEVRVSDDGPGIADEIADEIFTPFFTTAADSDGTGLGLAIVRSYLGRHGGEITLVPSPRGAVFRLILPTA